MSCVIFLWSISINLWILALENDEQFLQLLNIEIGFLFCEFISENKLKVCPVFKKNISELKCLGNWLNAFKIVEIIFALLEIMEAFDVVLQLEPGTLRLLKRLNQRLSV